MKRFIQQISLIFFTTLVLTACGGETTTVPPQFEQPTEAPEAEEVTEIPVEEVPDSPLGVELPAVNPPDVPGDVVSAGSSTVFPLAEVIAGLYEGEGGGNITIDSISSGAGFERFCVTGESDLSNASRAIKDSEVESCAAINLEPIEFRVGTDAIAVALSLENDFVTDVTMEELAAIFSTAETLADVRPEWPAEAIRAVPNSLRQASYGVGATRWQAIWNHVLPNSLPGILTGAILAISRAIGETAPLVVVGASTYITSMIDDPSTIDQANYLMWAAHNLERAADRVINICERTVYIATGYMKEIQVSGDEQMRVEFIQPTNKFEP